MKYDQIAQQVENGDIDPLEAYIDLKRAEKDLKNSLKIVQEYALTEAEKHGEKTFKYSDAEVTVNNGAGRWSFKHLAWWNTFQLEQEAAKQSYKMSLKSQKMITDDGEVIEPAEYTEGKTTLSIKL